MIGKAINILAVAQDDTMRWSYDGFITNETEFNNISVEDDKSFNFTWADVQAKATELEAEDNAKEDVKTSAKAKLIAGEALTEDEANTIVL
jgi:hypothetical protein